MTDAIRLLTADDWEDYALLDSGSGRKLERFGRIVTDRPDPQAFWRPMRPLDSWRANAVFASREEDDERGSWTFPGAPPPDGWEMRWRSLRFSARCAAFRHLGVFPEHSVHWGWAMDRIAGAGRPIQLLNLFGYTGIMSLAAAAAGAEVVHLDASPKSIGYGRENQSLSGLGDKPIRWICDDAMKFLEREVRRGRKYDAIVLDPPKFGRGPKNEFWRFEEDFSRLLDLTRQLLSDDPAFVILTVYAVRLSFISVAQSLGQAMEGLGGSLESGEMCLIEPERGLRLPTALYARWSSVR